MRIKAARNPLLVSAALMLSLDPAGARAEVPIAIGFAGDWSRSEAEANETAGGNAAGDEAGGGPSSTAAIVVAPGEQRLATPTFQPAFGAARIPGLSPASDRVRALDCLTMAIAYEAGNQSPAGQQAVGQVILNRVRAGRFQRSVCGVVFAGSERITGCQFTFTCDGSLNRRLRDETWASARNAAATVLAGAAPDRVGGATHYHADYVLPYWAASGRAMTKIGAHIFYRMPGDLATSGPPVISDGPEPEVPAMPKLRQRRRPLTLATATPAAARPMFAPWGLPVAGGTR